MIISIVIKAAASLATGVLALSSTRNMFETYKMIINHRKIGTYTMDHILEDSINPSLLQKYITCDKEGRIMLSIDSKVVSSQEIVNDLQHMSRKDLLRLFLLCDSHVDEKEIIGEWDGILLNNNSVLTSVSGFITNKLFGRKYNGWKGKVFKIGNTGINRFQSKANSSIKNEHTFDYSVKESKIAGKGILLDYTNYQGSLSPWRSMKDEIRIIRSPTNNVDEKNDYDFGIILGMGSIGWSGAFLNCQPFCLLQNNSTILVDETLEIKK